MVSRRTPYQGSPASSELDLQNTLASLDLTVKAASSHHEVDELKGDNLSLAEESKMTASETPERIQESSELIQYKRHPVLQEPELPSLKVFLLTQDQDRFQQRFMHILDTHLLVFSKSERLEGR